MVLPGSIGMDRQSLSVSERRDDMTLVGSIGEELKVSTKENELSKRKTKKISSNVVVEPETPVNKKKKNKAAAFAVFISFDLKTDTNAFLGSRKRRSRYGSSWKHKHRSAIFAS